MTDPIKNDFDGPLLHILRHYRPEKAYLFMTKRVCELADQDDRYRVQAQKLCDELGFRCEIFELRHEDIDRPQEYDVFYPLFERALYSIHAGNPGCQVLINLSSGTPQMKSACNLLALTAPFPVVPIQVTTPMEAENYGSPDYDIERTWKDDVDNDMELGAHNRSVVVTADNLRYLLLREAAVSHINNYDYSAALSVLELVEGFVPPQVMRLLNGAWQRKSMNLGEATREMRLGGYDLYPKVSGDARDLFEYLLLLGIQQKQGLLMDFIRGISPALTRLLEAFLNEKCARHIRRDYCVPFRSDPDHLRVVRTKLAANDPRLLAFYDQWFKPEFRDSDMSCSALLPMIEFDCRPSGTHPNPKALKTALVMRTVEDKVRNPAAHNIVAVKEEWFKKVAGLSSVELLRKMHWMFQQSYSQYIGDPGKAWGAYDEMNKYIISQLKA